MNTGIRFAAPRRAPIDNHRRTALIVGVLFVLTLITGIGEAILYGPVIDDPNYILGPGADSTVLLGAVFGIGIVITNIATSLVLYPLLRRQNETLALGVRRGAPRRMRADRDRHPRGPDRRHAAPELRRVRIRIRSWSRARRSSASIAGRSCSGRASSPASATG